MEQELNRSVNHWYALHTKPHKEKSVSLLLKEHEIETFFPMMFSLTSHKQKRHVPFFRGYIFASLNLDTGNSAPWRWTPGLRYIVSYGDEPIPIPDDVILQLDQKAQEMSSWAKIHEHPFKPGDTVQIKSGPFRDMLAVFQGPTTPSERVQILLTALHRSVRVRTEATNLEIYTGKSGHRPNKRQRRSRGRGRPIS